MAQVKIDFDKQNERVLAWADRSQQDLQSTGNRLGIQHRANSPSSGSSLAAIKHKERYQAGIIEVIGFQFRRSLIWPHKGAGKGMGGTQGSTWYDRLGIRHTTDPDSLGKMNSGNRQEKPWFNETMDAPTGVDELATIVAEESGDAIVNNLLIK